jgi:ketosteroid isomerase-like protein
LQLKLATNQASLGEIEEEHNKRVVVALYEALASKDIKTAHRLLPPDLEWWFHGPPIHQQHLISLLTNQSTSTSSSTRPSKSFIFHPISNIVAFGSMVLVEGFNKDWNVSWVHAWTVTNGIITQVKEYFNTSVTVTRFGDGGSIASSLGITSQPRANCQSVWQSKVSDNKSVPGLVLALC